MHHAQKAGLWIDGRVVYVTEVFDRASSCPSIRKIASRVTTLLSSHPNHTQPHSHKQWCNTAIVVQYVEKLDEPLGHIVGLLQPYDLLPVKHRHLHHRCPCPRLVQIRFRIEILPSTYSSELATTVLATTVLLQ